ncbi:protein translocase subunit SecDF [Prevotella sp. E15-22]|uniref:protein translocase subunit SecDF n=1 Tax=Prevotella sp. E15-22 TaxID=2937774 RepID=UPI00206A6C49|nr:protein translocase subunit SecDF [Prevotella sp. E15-22]UPS44735.1 protein translocase subunit SecDF [Prevotella sp. E15-22]
MQNKGIVKFIAVALILVCCFYLSFSFVTRHYESKAEALRAELGDKAAEEYLDSISSEDHIWLGAWSLDDCREMEIGLGLDLKGGMNVILEVSVPDIVNFLAGNKYNTDEGYRKAFDAAKADGKNNQSDFIAHFVERWKEFGGGRNLNAVFATQQLRDKVNTKSTDEEVVAALNDEVEAAIDNAETVVRTRVDKFGVAQPNIQKLSGQSRIMVEMPGAQKDKDRILKLLAGSADLQFHETYMVEEAMPYILQLANTYMAEMSNVKAGKKAEVADTAAVEAEAADSVNALDLAAAAAQKSELAQEGGKDAINLLTLLDTRFAGQESQCMVGYAHVTDTAEVNRVINSEIAKTVLPKEMRLYWDAKITKLPLENGKKIKMLALYAIKISDPNGKAPLTGDVVTTAKDDYSNEIGNVGPVVSMQMNTEGTRIWANLTKMNVGRAIAIVLDEAVYSAPRVNGEIPGGSSQISGKFTQADTKDLANTLNSGKMPAPLSIASYQMVGPSLGAQSIQQGIVSFIVAFVLLMVVMVVLYNWIPGMLANCALLFNLFFTLGILTSFQAALTMPGIAGIVLTLGTAVDANVLIYERTKEELRRGLNIKEALNKGYSNAFSAIFDSNLTSLITGIILFVFGTGPIRGFATTLIIGICVSFFTAVFMTRLVYDRQMKKDKWQNLTFSTGLSQNLMQGTKFNFMGAYKMSYAVWAVAAIIFVISFAVRGLSKSIDFTGGRNYVVVLDKQVPVEDVREAFTGAFAMNDEQSTNPGAPASTSIIALGEAANRTVRISTNWDYDVNSPAVDDIIEDSIYGVLTNAGLINAETSKMEFRTPPANESDTSKGTIVSSTKVGPSVAKTITKGAIISVLLALIAIFLYILLRFRNLAFSVGAIFALALDALAVIGFYSLLHTWVPMSLEIDQTFIGAILTVIGYSINDKVVVFDRIRENMALYNKRDRKHLFNDSLNQTLARTINTSVTTLIVLLTIFFLGGDSIRSFAFAMILGVVFGTLSSIFIAAPTAYLTMSKKDRKEELEAVAEA